MAPRGRPGARRTRRGILSNFLGVHTDEGFHLAADVHSEGGSSTEVRVWFSPDGRQWEDPRTFPASGLDGLVAGPDRAYLLLRSGGPDAAGEVWVADGGPSTWERVAGLPQGPQQADPAVPVPVGERLLAVTGQRASHTELHRWAGGKWRREELPGVEVTNVTGIRDIDGTSHVLGAVPDAAGSTGDLVVWRRTGDGWSLALRPVELPAAIPHFPDPDLLKRPYLEARVDGTTIAYRPAGPGVDGTNQLWVHRTPNRPGGPSTPATSDPTCSAEDAAPSLTPQPQLPETVATTRQRLAELAAGCDLQGLVDLQYAGGNPPDEDGATARTNTLARWQRWEGAVRDGLVPRSSGPTRVLLDVLETPPEAAPRDGPGEDQTVYTWTGPGPPGRVSVEITTDGTPVLFLHHR